MEAPYYVQNKEKCEEILTGCTINGRPFLNDQNLIENIEQISNAVTFGIALTNLPIIQALLNRIVFRILVLQHAFYHASYLLSCSTNVDQYQVEQDMISMGRFHYGDSISMDDPTEDWWRP